MITKDFNAFRTWIESCHNLIYIFEPIDVYPICIRLTQEWINHEKYIIHEDDIRILKNIKKSIKYDIYTKNDKVKQKNQKKFS